MFTKNHSKFVFSKNISSNLMFVGFSPFNLICFLFIFGVIGGSWGDFWIYRGPIGVPLWPIILAYLEVCKKALLMFRPDSLVDVSTRKPC